MENELGEKIPVNEVKEKLTKHFEYLFEANFSRQIFNLFDKL